MSELVERARAALEGYSRAVSADEAVGEAINGANIAGDALAAVVPELVAEVERLDSTLFLIREARIDYDAALRNREHGAVAAQRFVDAVESALDGGDQ